MLEEAVAVASASGYAPREVHLQISRQRLTEAGSALTASMMRDMLAGGRTEAEALTGDLVRRGLALGVAVPLLQVAWTRLQMHEQRWAASEGSAHHCPRA
jgi:2-dehydropantoate 2-reductase